MMDRSKDAEYILQHLGSWGLWQITIYALHAANFGSLALHSGVGVFYVDTPPYHCKVPANSTFNDTIPAKWKDGQVTWFDSCQEYVNRSHSNLTQPCSNGYWFDPDYGYEATVTTDFELVCDKAIVIEHSMMMNSIIGLVTTLLCSYLIDKFGRKTMLVIGVLARPIFGIADSYMPNFYVKWGVGVVGMILQMGLTHGSFLMALEMMPSDKRTVPGTLMELIYGIVKVLITPVIYFFRDWRQLTRALIIPTFLFYFLILAPESITWLVQKGKYKRVKKIVKQAARVNRKEPAPEITNLLDARIAEGSVNKLQGITEAKEEKEAPEKAPTQNEGKKEFKLIDLVKSPKIRRYTLIQVFVWFVNTYVYFTLTLTMTYLPGDRYINFLFYGLAEILSAVLHITLLIKFGRRIPMFWFHIFAGVGLLLTIVEAFKDQLAFDWVPLVIVFNMVGFVGIGSSFMTIYLYTPEVFPTQVRGLAWGLCQAVSGLAGLIAPYSRVFERNIPGILRGICGVMAIVAGILVLFLPETHNRPLPETIEDVEMSDQKVKAPQKVLSPEGEKMVVSEEMCSF